MRLYFLTLLGMFSFVGALHAEPLPPSPALSKNNRPVVLNPLCRIFKGCRNGAAYMTIYLPGPDVLKKAAVSPDIADHVELHTHQEKDGVMHMTPLPQMPVPTGVLELKSGEDHLMLIGLKKELQPGEKLCLSLEFEEAGTLEVEVLVEGPDWKKKSSSDKICHCEGG